MMEIYLGVGYLKVPKNMTENKLLKNKKDKTNGTIDFYKRTKGFFKQKYFLILCLKKET